MQYFLYIGVREDEQYSFIEGTTDDDSVKFLWPSAIIKRKYELPKLSAFALDSFLRITDRVSALGWNRVVDVYWNIPLKVLIEVIEKDFKLTPLEIIEEMKVEYLEILI